MKRSILCYRLYKTALIIVLLLFVAFLIASINVKKAIFTSLAIVFGILTIIFVFGHGKISQNAWYKQAKRELRKRAYDKIKTSPKGFAQYFLPLETSHSEMDFSQLLEGYTRYKLNNAVVYVKQTISPYNTKKNSFNVFYLSENDLPSMDYEVETDRMHYAISQIQEHFASPDESVKFIDCVVLYRHNAITQEQIDFYYSFVGLWECEMGDPKYARRGEELPCYKNIYCNICGIDNATKAVYFYKALPSDDGTEADMSWLIKESLKIKKCSPKK